MGLCLSIPNQVSHRRKLVEKVNELGETELILAAKSGHYQRCLGLISAGAAVNYYNDRYYYYTPLISASYGGHVDIINLLLDAGADIEKKGNDGYSPLFIAASKGYYEAVKILCSRGADVHSQNMFNKTPLMGAIAKGDLEIVHFLLSQGAQLVSKDRNGKILQLALNEAAQRNRLDIVPILLQRGANVNETDEYGWTPLLTASIYHNFEMCKLLVQHGANVKICDRQGVTPLMYSLSTGIINMVKYFLEQGSDIEAKTYMGDTALLLAVERSKVDCVKLLLQWGAETDIEDKFGNTLLSAAAKVNAFDIVKILLPFSTDAQIKKFHVALEEQESLNDIFTEVVSTVKSDKWYAEDDFKKILIGLRSEDADLIIFRLVISICPFRLKGRKVRQMIARFIKERDNLQDVENSCVLERFCDIVTKFLSTEIMKKFDSECCKCRSCNGAVIVYCECTVTQTFYPPYD